MVYVNSNGEVVNSTPFSFYNFLFEIYLAFLMFCKTLVAPLTGGSVNDPDSASRYRDNLRGRNGGSSGGGGGGWGSGGGPPRGPPRRPMGRLNTLPQQNIPSCASGGCCG
ncbi:hypothetical protein M3Y98_00437300 [Aphelenchoides besseyi]|nr:hypothetical protein M3Y98_00437300 [Aphelenchoides besseyi]KAI6202315.1 hypothetical protein M3Y96_00935100 [Aphelenchoides besseyi]